MRNLKITITFDGSRYKGWQTQKNPDITIQGKIEAVLSRMAEEDIKVIGCGRTDAGVHAENYIANFHTNSKMKLDEILDCAYEYLPEDIQIKFIEEAPERFNAMYNVKSRTYVYTINNNRFRDVFNRKYSIDIPQKLDVEAMKRGAETLVGTHDFQSFTNEKSNKSTIKTIYSIDLTEKGGLIEIAVNGSGFLWNMVRIIAGTLIEVGLGNLEASEIERILSEKKRWQAGPMAPAKGLSLREVHY